MATPNWDLVPVRGRFVGSDGTPVTGRVIFTPKVSRLVDEAAKRIIIGRSTAVTLDNDGQFETYLPATDDPDITPVGFTWTVREDFVGGSTYDIEVPLAAAALGLELATVAPVPPNTGGMLTPVTRLEFEDLRDLVLAGGGGEGGGPISANLVTFVPTGSISATNAQSAIAEVANDAATALDNHVSATTAHSAAQIAVTGISGFTTVQAALVELFENGGGGGGGPVAASAVTFSPTGSIAATNVQAAIAEVATDAATALSGHTGASSGAHAASAISVSGISGFTNVQAALQELFTNGGGGSGSDPTKMSITATFTSAPSSPQFRRNLNYTINVADPNLFEVYNSSTMRMWLNEWGALRGRNPYPTYADALVRAIIDSGDFTGTSGGGGNALEIVDRTIAGNRVNWGRRWSGELVRNDIVMTDVYVRKGGSGESLPANLPNCVVLTAVTPIPVV